MAAANPNQYEILPAPSDGISQLRIQNNRLLMASSWDAHVRIYDLQTNQLKTFYQHKAAVLDCVFAPDRGVTYSGGIDKTIKSETTLGSHDRPVRCVEFSSAIGALISGSWDSTVKLWDTRSKGALIGTWKQPDKVFAMSTVNEKLVVATAGRHVQIYDVRNMDEPLQSRESSLKYQTRAVSCHPNGSGFVLGSVEGRAAVEYFDPSNDIQAKRYAFKCHRQMVNGIDTLYPVNSIAFNPAYGTFATGGCDGLVYVWDGEHRKRLSQYSRFPTSISALAFSEDGMTLAIASSYTFEEGERDAPADQIFIRHVSEVEVKPKAKA
ncbi:hypothetical protein PROFUN_06857 [Planoprotostelium fungivorum]|uniref:Uncharacterized protein n=1 Tax=Planoprotostelium fungivorum TaxID=1890364 RepID=A0A2P6NNL1_9EUKA|nr:hypothetical protein PROFUN_06857 [Planoprotostelium fungivorum]